MWCPQCKSGETKVLDSRYVPGSNTIRRRRTCQQCQYRFTTREYVELRLPRVVKKDKTQCQFVTSKLKRGVMLALEKRPISAEVVETLISNILEKISQVAQNDEISTEQIGYIVLAELKKTDAVAYVRFASVYQSFNSVESFRSVVTDLEENSKLNHEIGG
ncbi:MAG: transcriptional regulator NrdR [Pseudomonadota bacterium]|nr:transcriptional regulator NrdR [Pseudomonadota bacterium]